MPGNTTIAVSAITSDIKSLATAFVPEAALDVSLSPSLGSGGGLLLQAHELRGASRDCSWIRSGASIVGVHQPTGDVLVKYALDESLVFQSLAGSSFLDLFKLFRIDTNVHLRFMFLAVFASGSSQLTIQIVRWLLQ